MPPTLGTVLDLKWNLKPVTTFPLETATGSDNHLATSPLDTPTLGKDHLAYLPLVTPTGSDDHLNTFPMETPLEVTIVSDCPLYIHRRPGMVPHAVYV